MEVLYILGNGFDLNHNLPTTYQSFHKYLKEHFSDLESKFDEYFQFKTDDDYLWMNFEEDLGTFDWRGFYEDFNNLEPLADDFRPSFVFSLEDELNDQSEHLYNDIRKTFQDWLETIDISTTIAKFKFSQNSKFLSFNYTLLLENVYNIEINRILHIHGDIEHEPEELVLGHKSRLEEVPEFDENSESNRTMFSDSESASKTPFYFFQKPVGDLIKSNLNFFKSLTTVKAIYVLGHSLNEIDMPYFKQILTHTKNANWNVSYHKASEKQKHFDNLVNLGVNPSSIYLFEL